MAAAALQRIDALAPAERAPSVPWRDPHTVLPEELAGFIRALEAACDEHPHSADLRTGLGMAYAMNLDVYKSWDALEAARRLDPAHFFAQLKYAELLYRLRILEPAEQETLRALALARNAWEAALCRKQLSEIRRLRREGTQKPAWTKPLRAPVLMLSLLIAIVSLVSLWR